LRADVQAASGFGSLAAELDFGGGADTGAETRLVDFTAGGFARSLPGASAKRCTREHDCLLVHQHFVRSAPWSQRRSLLSQAPSSVRSIAQLRHFLFVRCVRWAASLFIPRCR